MLPIKFNKALLMGILNVTPDSFYDGGKYDSVDKALNHAMSMIESGVDIIDVGGESSRPGSAPVDARTECERVLPVIKELGKLKNVVVSIDTTKAEVADKALSAGASIINDISALQADKDMVKVAKQSGAYVVLMHMQGNPATMQMEPSYNNVVDEIMVFFKERIDFSVSNGIGKSKIILDPGIGFGKNLEHNLDIIANCSEFKKFGLPVLFGPSNKRYIGQFLENKDSETNRVWSTGVTVAYAMANGIDIFRVHNFNEIKIVMDFISAFLKRKKI